MTNHIHLALQAGKIPLSRGLQNLSFRYTRWINWLTETHRSEFHGGGEDSRILGDDGFIDRCLSDSRVTPLRLTIKEIADIICLAYDIDEEVLKAKTQQRVASEARAVVGWLARELDCATLSDVGRYINRDVGTVSSAVRRLSEHMRDRPEMAERVLTLKIMLERST